MISCCCDSSLFSFRTRWLEPLSVYRSVQASHHNALHLTFGGCPLIQDLDDFTLTILYALICFFYILMQNRQFFFCFFLSDSCFAQAFFQGFLFLFMSGCFLLSAVKFLDGSSGYVLRSADDSAGLRGSVLLTVPHCFPAAAFSGHSRSPEFSLPESSYPVLPVPFPDVHTLLLSDQTVSASVAAHSEKSDIFLLFLFNCSLI